MEIRLVPKEGEEGRPHPRSGLGLWGRRGRQTPARDQG